MLRFAEQLKNKENFFFENNKVLPWVQVAAYRSVSVPCVHLNEAQDEDKVCETELYS